MLLKSVYQDNKFENIVIPWSPVSFVSASCGITQPLQVGGKLERFIEFIFKVHLVRSRFAEVDR